VPERVRPDGLARGADRQHGRRLATANRLAPAQTRGQVLSTYFEFAYVGLTVPVIAVGFGSRAFGDFVTRPLTFTARTSDTSADAVTLTADVIIDRADFGMTWDKLGVAKGAATITVVAHFTRQR